MLLHRAFERWTLHLGIGLGPPRRLYDLERIGGSGQDLAEQRIRIERDRRDQLGHLLCAKRRLLGADRRRGLWRGAFLSGQGNVANERKKGEPASAARKLEVGIATMRLPLPGTVERQMALACRQHKHDSTFPWRLTWADSAAGHDRDGDNGLAPLAAGRCEK